MVKAQLAVYQTSQPPDMQDNHGSQPDLIKKKSLKVDNYFLSTTPQATTLEIYSNG